MLRFLYYYLRSMRLYYGFVTATTVLAGLWLAHVKYSETLLPWNLRYSVLLVMGFFAWGFNQIFSDWCDRKEDAINAPHRPMVTGALKPLPAFAVSAAGLAAIGLAGYLMSPWTLAFLALGGALNIAYSLLKRVPVLNCLVYACAISCCALFAIAGMANRCPTQDEFGIVAALIVPVHFLMCHNSYYKDEKGDRAAGVRTLQTQFRPVVAKSLTICMSTIAVFVSWLVAYGIGDDVGESWWRFLQPAMVALLASAHFLCLKKQYYHAATCLNCQLCVALLHTVWFDVSWLIEIICLIAIPLLFLWYNDEKE